MAASSQPLSAQTYSSSQSHRPSRLGTRGFSLIELVIVISIIGILSGSMAVISYQPNPIEVTAMAQQLASDLRYTQALSMTKGVRYQLVKNSATSYQIQSVTGTVVTLPMGNTVMTMGGGITITNNTNLPNNLLTFDGWGTPYTDNANTLLTAAAVITLTAVNGTTQTVTVTPTTGRVSVP